jgi:hypothetical protein
MSFDERNDEGFTLVELMVTAVLTLIVMMAVGGLLISMIRTPQAVTARVDASGGAQVAANSIELGIRNSSDFRLTSPQGTDQLLVARTAQSGATIVWLCSAWYYSATDQSIRFTTSPTMIPTTPTATDLSTWTVLDTSVTPASGTGIFTVSGEEVGLAFAGAVTGQQLPQSITTSAFSRAGSTGSPQCY